MLRAAVESGVDHLDTSDFYGPHITNQIIREALHPYRDDLASSSPRSVPGVARMARGSPPCRLLNSRRPCTTTCATFGLDVLEVVEPAQHAGHPRPPWKARWKSLLSTLAELQRQGLIRPHRPQQRHGARQVEDGRRICAIACVQNQYNLAHRADDALVDQLARDGIAYVPFFPLGGFTPLQSDALSARWPRS